MSLNKHAKKIIHLQSYACIINNCILIYSKHKKNLVYVITGMTPITVQGTVLWRFCQHIQIRTLLVLLNHQIILALVVLQENFLKLRCSTLTTSIKSFSHGYLEWLLKDADVHSKDCHKFYYCF